MVRQRRFERGLVHRGVVEVVLRDELLRADDLALDARQDLARRPLRGNENSSRWRGGDAESLTVRTPIAARSSAVRHGSTSASTLSSTKRGSSSERSSDARKTATTGSAPSTTVSPLREGNSKS